MKHFFLILMAIVCASLSKAQYTVNGNTTRDDCHCYTLTQAQLNQSGSVWNNFKINLTQSFDFNFDINLGCTDRGADGIAFVLQPISTSVGSTGGGLGFSGVMPSVGVTMDTYQNIEDNDPPEDHIAIQLNGDIDHNSAANIAGPVSILAGSSDVEDCRFHSLRVQWDAATRQLSAYVDGVLRVSATKDFITDVFGGDPNVFWGFTGSTGGENNVQRFCTALSPGFKLLPAQKRCLNEPITFYDSTVSFSPVQKRYWDFGDGSPVDSVNQNPVHTYAAAGDYTITQRVIGADGCIEVNTQTLRVGSIPVADFSVADSCANIALQFTDQSTTAVGTINEWTWDLGSAGTSSLQNPSPVYTTNGVKLITLKVKSLEGCESPVITRNFQVYPTPAANFSVAGTLCQKSVVQLRDISTVTPGSVGSVNYTFGNGQQSSLPNPTAVFDTAKNYSITQTVVSDKGCVNTKTTSINILSIPVAYFNFTPAGCSPVSINFTDSSYTTDGTAVNGWWWNLGNGNNATTRNPIGTYSTSGNINVQLVAKNTNGCLSDTLNKAILIPSSAVAKFGYITPLCEGQAVQFSDSSTVNLGTVKSWQWLVDNRPVSTDKNPLLNITAGNHAVQLIAYNENGCAGTPGTININVNPIPLAQISITGTCTSTPTNFGVIDLSGNNIQSWQWDFGDGATAAVKDTQHIYTDTGTYHVQLSLLSNSGCANLIDSNVVIYGTNASAGADTIIAAPGQPIQLQATGGVSYEWLPAAGLSNATIANPVATNTTNQLYTLRAYSPSGCDSYDQVLIRIFNGPEIYVPNAFTPDGNGTNDLLRAHPVGIAKLKRFTVYNRNGEIVFSTNNSNQGWDGTFQGKLQNSGAYVWIAIGTTFRGVEMVKKGTVLLLK